MTWVAATYLSDGGTTYPTHINLDHVASIGRNAEGRAVIRWSDHSRDALLLREWYVTVVEVVDRAR